MVADGPRHGDPAAGVGGRSGRGRGFVTMTRPLPRNVIAKPLASGATGFYFNVPTYYRKLGCAVPNEPLGSDYTAACGADGPGGRAAALNWRSGAGRRQTAVE